MGYETVAVNQTLDESIFDNEKKKKKKGTDGEIKSALPEPLDLTELRNEFANKLTILSRITFLFGDSSKIHTLAQSQILKKYDLFGVVPKTQAALQFACSQSNADVVTIKSAYSGLKFNRKLYLQAVERGVHFEIQYADILNESTRKYALHYSHLFYIFGKSRVSLIISYMLLLSMKIKIMFSYPSLHDFTECYYIQWRQEQQFNEESVRRYKFVSF